MPLLHFIIPVRHPDSVPDWSAVVSNLQLTLGSLANQSSPDWTCSLVHQRGARLPELPHGVTAVPVDIPSVQLPDDWDSWAKVVRLDKGRRVEAAVKLGLDAEYTMVVDYDDLLRDDLVAAVRDHAPSDAIVIARAWAFAGRRIVEKLEMSDRGVGVGGSAFAVRSDVLVNGRQLPPGGDRVTRYFGSHVFILGDLAAADMSITRLGDEPRLLYRVGDPHATSSTTSPLRSLGRDLRRRQVGAAVHRATRLRRLPASELARYGLAL